MNWIWIRAATLSLAMLGMSSPGLAQAPATAQALAQFDMANVIREAANRHAGEMKVSIAPALRRMDQILVSDYGARGRIGGEPNARLKSLYTQAAHLLMNGNPIAGGTLVVIARQEPAYARSACGHAFDAFVAGMLAPSDEPDDVLGAFAGRAYKARRVLSTLRPELQMAAQLRVMGAIYNDSIAVAAGDRALHVLQASAAERSLVDAALASAGVH